MLLTGLRRVSWIERYAEIMAERERANMTQFVKKKAEISKVVGNELWSAAGDADGAGRTRLRLSQPAKQI